MNGGGPGAPMVVHKKAMKNELLFRGTCSVIIGATEPINFTGFFSTSMAIKVPVGTDHASSSRLLFEMLLMTWMHNRIACVAVAGSHRCDRDAHFTVRIKDFSLPARIEFNDCRIAAHPRGLNFFSFLRSP